MAVIEEHPAAVRSDAGERLSSRLPRLEFALAGLLGLACLWTRLVNLERYSGSYPEGIRAEQLLLMAAGFRPFKDIFSDQGPWLLQALYPGYALFGGSLVGIRAGVVLGSLVGLIGMYWLLRQLGGSVGALGGVLLLGLSPIYLQFSRLAVAEVLALAPAILAVGCAVHFSRRPAYRWLVAAGSLLALSLLIKPITIGTALPVALAIWLGGGRRWLNVVLVGLVTAVVTLVGVLLVGLPEIVQQIVQFRAASREAEGWSLAANVKRFRVELAPEGGAFFALAAVGAGWALTRRTAWPLLLWVLAAAATILAHAPLHTKHFAIVVVPLAALGGYGIARSAAWLRPKAGRRGSLALSAGLALLFAVSAPPVLARDWTVLTSTDLFEGDAAALWYPDAIDTLRRVVGPEEYVITDHAYLAYAADRRIPPGLVEASATRVRAGSLTDELAIDTTRQYNVRAVLLWADKLVDLKRYRGWLTENFVPVKVWAVEGDARPVLWLRNDQQLESVRLALRQDFSSVSGDARFGAWRLATYRVTSSPPQPAQSDLAADGACDGAQVRVIVEWATTPEAQPSEGRVRLALTNETLPNSVAIDSEDEPLLGGVLPARWLFWAGALSLPGNAPPGSYVATAALADTRGRAFGPPASLSTVVVGRCAVR